MIFIKGIASLGAAMLIGLSAPSVQAGYVVDLTQQGGNVVATGSGAIDLTGLSQDCNGCDNYSGYLIPNEGNRAQFVIGAEGVIDGYGGATGPTNFGSGGFTRASSNSGDIVGVLVRSFGDEIEVPTGYVSGNSLSDPSTSTYLNQTFASLGVTPGTYTWTWGSAAQDDSFTLVIGTPEPSTWAMMLLGFTALGFMGYRSAGRRRQTVGNA
jgi:hypothetical protein